MCLIFLQHLILLQSTFHCSLLVQYLSLLIFCVLPISYDGFFALIYFWYFISQLSIQDCLIITFSLTKAFFSLYASNDLIFLSAMYNFIGHLARILSLILSLKKNEWLMKEAEVTEERTRLV